MKLQKLVISGFGPYAERQELDFEKNLQGKNMFVITGNTGAGKTTIFDAINFVLYGEASGSDRDSKALRSDFADFQTPTEVELWFSLRGKEYYVKRSPAYVKPKQRGEGFLESKPTAEIKLSKDKTITGANQVTKEVENILGITTEQFKQLVMIPQGEFKKLLNAKSEEKEDIFRKIFGTEIFQNIQNQIKDQANKLEKGIKDIQRDRLNKIRSFSCEDSAKELCTLINSEEPNIQLLMTSFSEIIIKDKEKQENIKLKVDEIEKIITKISNEIALGDTVNNKFLNLEKNKEELDKLTCLAGEYDEKKLSLEKAEKALNVKAYEDKYNERRLECHRLDIDINNIQKNLEEYRENYEAAEKQYKLQQEREVEKNKLINDIAENNRLIEKASKYENNKKNLEALEVKVKVIKDRINEISTLSLENEKNLQLLNIELEDINKSKDEKGKLEINLVDLKNRSEKLNNLNSYINKWIEENKLHKKLKDMFYILEEKFLVTKNDFELLEDMFRKNQAGILANDLIDGVSCPVCGSIHHPKLAKLENNEISEVLIKKNKEILEGLRKERDIKLEELTTINSLLSSIEINNINPSLKELLDINKVENIHSVKVKVEELINKNDFLLEELKNRIQNLFIIIKEESTKINLSEKIKNSNASLRKELEAKNAELVLEEGKLSAARNTLELIKNEFQGEIKTAYMLEKLIKSLNETLQHLKNDLEKAEKAFNSTKSILDQEDGKYKSTIIMKTNSEEELNKAKILFSEKAKELGFNDFLTYKASCLPEIMIKELDKEINEYLIKLARVQQSYKDSSIGVQGLSRIDTSILKEKLIAQNSIKTSFVTESNEVFSRIKNNVNILEDCEKYNKAIEIDENNYKTIGKLSNLINGENAKKISFERYVLAAYFEDIIEASNIRFVKMTTGRFELLRKQEVGDKRKGHGLDLEVFDNYTGKSRDVKTLSGGESFKASLSMALGLADIVQSNAGGIQLDTMFIDEGFGTLDPESLDNAVECLMDLQNDGRLVGIISHVPELKEKINARLEVNSTNKGSVACFKV